MLRLYVLYAAEDIAGAIYTFTHRRRTYCYLAGFDPRYKPFNPGTLLIAYTIESALAEHCETVDFLRGDEAYTMFLGSPGSTHLSPGFFSRREKLISMHSETLLRFVDYCIVESADTRSFVCRDQQLISGLDS